MKHLRLWTAFFILAFLAAVGSAARVRAQGSGNQEFIGGSYLTIITDSAGNFASRSVFTLHADGTMSGMDSGQAGPAFFFSTQRGSWRLRHNGKIDAKMINFVFPPSEPGIARLDYSISFERDINHVKGTITLRMFGLNDKHENPLEDGGEYIDTYSFTGELIKP